MDNASRRRIVLLATASILVLGAPYLGAMNLQDIVRLVEQSASSTVGMTNEKEQTAQQVRSLGPQAIPYLLPLLRKYENGAVRELTSYILRDMEGLAEEHLDALIESRRNGDVSIPPAIARVGTPKAIAFLVEDLKGLKKFYDTELTAAFEILGERGVPPLVDLIRSGSLNYGLETAVANIFGHLRGKAESAVAPLTEFVASRQGDLWSVRCAILSLGAIGPKARSAVPTLLQLPQGGSEHLGRIVDRALVEMEAPEAVARLSKRLEGRPDSSVFQQIISLRENGRELGPALVRSLREANRFTRIEAAATLGYIGYVEAIPDLVQLLNVDNWRLVHACVESLGRLHAVDALGPLREIAESHWHPAVHEAATMAVQVISGKASYEPKSSYMALTQARWPERRESSVVAEAGSNRFYADEKDRLDREQLKKIADIIEGNASVADQSGQSMKSRAAADWWRLPGVGIKVDDGYLVGFYRGEFIGKLVFVDLKGNQTMLLHDNVRGIHRIASGVVVVTGLDHLGTDRGALFRVWKDDKGGWHVSQWKVLPGAPFVSGVRPNGNLFVACNGGKVEISPSGDVMRVGN